MGAGCHRIVWDNHRDNRRHRLSRTSSVDTADYDTGHHCPYRYGGGNDGKAKPSEIALFDIAVPTASGVAGSPCLRHLANQNAPNLKRQDPREAIIALPIDETYCATSARCARNLIAVILRYSMHNSTKRIEKSQRTSALKIVCKNSQRLSKWYFR